METRIIRRSGLKVTRMGLGLAALGRPGYINIGHGDDIGDTDVHVMERQAHTVMDAAWAAGVRYFDAARSYGKAEVFLGSWLKARGIVGDDITIGSKWGYTYTADWQVNAETHEVKSHTLPVLQRQWGETQANLGDYLKLYQVHSATLESGIFNNHRVLAQLVKLKDSGVVIGASVSGSQQAATIAEALSIAADGVPIFDTIQVTWNLLERSTTSVLQEAHDAGVGVIVKEALANGRLTPRNPESDFAGQYGLLQQQAARLGATIDALALAGVLAQPWADVVLSGAATVEHLASNVAALQVGWDDEAESALQAIIEPPEKYWQTRAALDWN